MWETSSQVSICYNQMSKSKKAYLISSERIFSYAISQQTNTCSIQEWHTKKMLWTRCQLTIKTLTICYPILRYITKEKMNKFSSWNKSCPSCFYISLLMRKCPEQNYFPEASVWKITRSVTLIFIETIYCSCIKKTFFLLQQH